ncbi:hypothetical protein DPV78_010900 [Talaromyces pinophilus]|nr:hypothetical protein DPV78_010900 [Talaromyces pinophilus]
MQGVWTAERFVQSVVVARIRVVSVMVSVTVLAYVDVTVTSDELDADDAGIARIDGIKVVSAAFRINERFEV